MLNIRLLNLDDLTPERRAELATVSRAARPDALTREEFAELARRWRERAERIDRH